MSKSLACRGKIARNFKLGKYVPLISEKAHTGVVLSNGAKQVTVVDVRGRSRGQGSKARNKTGSSEIGEIRVLFSRKPTHQVQQALEIWKKEGRVNPTATRTQILKLFGKTNSHPLDVILKENISANLPQPFVRFIKLYFKRSAK